MSLTVSATPSLIELYEDKKRRIQEWISHTPTPSSGGFADAFSPPSTTPSLASLDEEFHSEKEEHSQRHSQANSDSSSDTFVQIDQPRELSQRFPPYSPQFPPVPGPSIQPLYSSPLPISTPAPIKPIPISSTPIQLELASLGPLKQRQLAKPLHLPMATHAYPTHRHQHQPIVIASPRRHGFHRHHNYDDHEREYDRHGGHRHHQHHRHRSPSPVRSRARSRSGTRARSQPARAHHIEETPQFSNSQTREIDDRNIVLPADYHPVSGSGGGHHERRGRAESGEGRVGRMMGRMGMTTSRSRPQGQGGPAEGQPGPINPNASAHHQPNSNQTSPTNLYQNIGQLAGAAVEQYVQGKIHGEHGHAHHPSHSHHRSHGRHSSPSRYGERSTHNNGHTRHRSASVAQSYSQPVQQGYTATTPMRPVYTRRRSKSVDERDLGGYRSRYATHTASPQVQQATGAAAAHPIAGSTATVVQPTNQPLLVPINHGRGGWAVVPPVGQEIRVIVSFFLIFASLSCIFQLIFCVFTYSMIKYSAFV